MKKRAKPGAREVILQVRPISLEHPWWLRDAELDEWLWASIDPYDPPGWSAGRDDDYKIDAIELWSQNGMTVEQYIESMKSEWLEEHGKEEADEIIVTNNTTEVVDVEFLEGDGYAWEFRILEVTTASAQVAVAAE